MLLTKKTSGIYRLIIAVIIVPKKHPNENHMKLFAKAIHHGGSAGGGQGDVTFTGIFFVMYSVRGFAMPRKYIVSR